MTDRAECYTEDKRHVWGGWVEAAHVEMARVPNDEAVTPYRVRRCVICAATDRQAMPANAATDG